jgi:hypothetical protein
MSRPYAAHAMADIVNHASWWPACSAPTLEVQGDLLPDTTTASAEGSHEQHRRTVRLRSLAVPDWHG